jgi:hypothetical protein
VCSLFSYLSYPIFVASPTGPRKGRIMLIRRVEWTAPLINISTSNLYLFLVLQLL